MRWHMTVSQCRTALMQLTPNDRRLPNRSHSAGGGGELLGWFALWEAATSRRSYQRSSMQAGSCEHGYRPAIPPLTALDSVNRGWRCQRGRESVAFIPPQLPLVWRPFTNGSAGNVLHRRAHWLERAGPPYGAGPIWLPASQACLKANRGARGVHPTTALLTSRTPRTNAAPADALAPRAALWCGALLRGGSAGSVLQKGPLVHARPNLACQPASVCYVVEHAGSGYLVAKAVHGTSVWPACDSL